MGFTTISKAVRTILKAYLVSNPKAIDWEDAPRQALFDKGKNLYDGFAMPGKMRVNKPGWRPVENGRAASGGDYPRQPRHRTQTKISFAEPETASQRAGVYKRMRLGKGGSPKPRDHLYAIGPRSA